MRHALQGSGAAAAADNGDDGTLAPVGFAAENIQQRLTVAGRYGFHLGMVDAAAASHFESFPGVEVDDFAGTAYFKKVVYFAPAQGRPVLAGGIFRCRADGDFYFPDGWGCAGRWR